MKTPTTPTFVFDESRLRARIPDHTLLAALRRFIRTPGKHRRQDFDKWHDRPVTSQVIVRRFNGWRRALWSAGLPSARGGNYSPEELIQILEQVWRKLGRAPGHAPLFKLGRISTHLYTRHWGSLKKARTQLARFHRNEISREELLARCAPTHNRDAVRPGTRYKVLHRDNYRCQLCGRTPTTDPDLILEIDHINPVANGGNNTLENLRTLCRPCNRGKGAA
jgi:hypothetical protein